MPLTETKLLHTICYQYQISITEYPYFSALYKIDQLKQLKGHTMMFQYI